MYIDGFVVPVPTGRKADYIAMATKAWPMFREFGATSMMEGWGDDVPKGKITDFQGAVKAQDSETVVFSWIIWPDKATRDAGHKKMMDDPRMQDMKNMPFDGKRMIFGGFVPIFDGKA
jgi:uncharacterized protein YbaA (DUF1428 family)